MTGPGLPRQHFRQVDPAVPHPKVRLMPKLDLLQMLPQICLELCRADEASVGKRSFREPMEASVGKKEASVRKGGSSVGRWKLP